MNKFRVGVDIGGTFTDIVLWGKNGEVFVKKVTSSTDDYARAIIEGIGNVFKEQHITASLIEQVRHGTTVASNAILERKGAKTGLIGSKGFRDVLEIRTLRMPRLYDLAWTKPPPLVERCLRVTVDERISFSGEVIKALSIEEGERAVRTLLERDVEAIAVCLINSYVNPEHEFFLKSIIERVAPDIPMSISAEVLPEIREYERTSTTTINAYVKPIVASYLETLESGLRDVGIDSELLLMQSNGGLTPVDTAARLPMNIIESGPAGGVVGSRLLAQKAGLGDLITFDMGGTTAKASMVEGGEYARADDFEVGGGILVGSRLLTGAGYLLKTQAIDLAEVGAGGGSLISIDSGGALNVGPESAGAFPGPICYDLGGDEPTVTDANLVLGYLNPNAIAGGTVKLNSEKSIAVFNKKIAALLGLTVEQAALGARRVAASNMIRAIKAVSTERGRDPRQYTLCAFGGNGPMFAAEMAMELGIKNIIIPPAPGVFSAFGLLYSDVEHHYSKTVRVVLRDADPDLIGGAWKSLEKDALKQLRLDGFSKANQLLTRTASLHYKGQTFELTVAAPSKTIDRAALEEIEQAFHAEHEMVYGHRASDDEPVELVTVRLLAKGLDPSARELAKPKYDYTNNHQSESRLAYFGQTDGWQQAEILTRNDLREAKKGPCIIEEYDATCVVPPRSEAVLDANGCISLTFNE